MQLGKRALSLLGLGFWILTSCGGTGSAPRTTPDAAPGPEAGGTVGSGGTSSAGSATTVASTGGNVGSGGATSTGGATTVAGTGGSTIIAGSGGKAGQTEFISEEPTSPVSTSSADAAVTYAGSAGSSGAAGATAASTPSTTDSTTKEAAPSGRVGEVEEADIYKIDGTRLYYFNTYRGFLVFDIADPKAPKTIARLPVYGYPIEMFVTGTTVYALLRDALYLTQVDGKPVFERRNVSQLVAIDISNPAQPTIIKTVDIIGQLREGVSRKIDNTIYVVSYLPQNYYYGWSYQRTTTTKEQAWVYSFDVSDAKNPKKVNELQIFEGGSVQFTSNNSSYNKYFQGVSISATSNALMVVENWYVYSYSSSATSSTRTCGSYESNQQSVVSIIDISDPKGTIRRHTRFEANGTVSDQFKMTYVYDETAKTGTFFGIFARQVWSSASCSGTSYTQNTLESWDITDGANPVRLARLDFGKQNETVRGTAFDVQRNVAYAITAQRIDPLYAISIADRKNLKILSAVDGLSGDMSVFRLIADRQFLIAVGTDTSTTCTGFDTGTGRQAAQVAVSIIDVRDLNKVRLVQRKCVSVDGAAWGTGSGVSSNLDQAHKMIGMFSDAQANVITVPVYYTLKADDTSDWWYYRYQTAVGIMAWDLAKYDDTKDETQQQVITNYGTFVHPNGQVRRTIVYSHPVTKRRSMLNLSDTHASLADIQDLAKPEAQSNIEIAPYYSEIYRFGDYLVEHVQPKASSPQEPHEFRVRGAKGGLSVDPVASFTVGQVQRVIKQGSNLVLMGNISRKTDAGTTSQITALVYDLSNPAAPRKASQIALPAVTMPYYYYYCGWSPWGGYWFNVTNTWVTAGNAIVMLNTQYNYGTSPYTVTANLVILDLTDPANPQLGTEPIFSGDTTAYYAAGTFALMADGADPSSFYVTTRTKIGQVTHDNYVFTQYKYFAERRQVARNASVVREKFNLPGPLVNTWAAASGERMFLTRESSYLRLTTSSGGSTYQTETKLALLRQVGSQAAAELLDSKVMTGLSLSALVREGTSMVVTGQPYYYSYSSTTSPTWEQTSDHFLVFDLSANRLDLAYDQPTKAYNLRIMGTQKGRAFLNLQGDGIVVIDIAKPTSPTPVRFLRTLGYATHLESFGDDVYVASGYFGTEHMSLNDPPTFLTTGS